MWYRGFTVYEARRFRCGRDDTAFFLLRSVLHTFGFNFVFDESSASAGVKIQRQDKPGHLARYLPYLCDNRSTRFSIFENLNWGGWLIIRTEASYCRQRRKNRDIENASARYDYSRLYLWHIAIPCARFTSYVYFFLICTNKYHDYGDSQIGPNAQR